MVGVVKVVGVVRLPENTQREKRGGLVHAGRKREVVGRTCATAASSGDGCGSGSGGGGGSRWEKSLIKREPQEDSERETEKEKEIDGRRERGIRACQSGIAFSSSRKSHSLVTETKSACAVVTLSSTGDAARGLHKQRLCQRDEENSRACTKRMMKKDLLEIVILHLIGLFSISWILLKKQTFSRWAVYKKNTSRGSMRMSLGNDSFVSCEGNYKVA
ncbi:hypothetical protein M0802_003273 [Mischocyttarus mexicanus]|nr:hypothetical protein M0802_003273 [Mischocyttarus mexicanus]